MNDGWTEKVSKCCKAPREHHGDVFDGYYKCSKCGRGSWPHGVDTDFIYHPSDYEQGLEKRIAELEKRLATSMDAMRDILNKACCVDGQNITGLNVGWLKDRIRKAL